MAAEPALPRSTVNLGGRVWQGSKPCKGGPAVPPPAAAYGLDRVCYPAIVSHQAVDGKLRLNQGKGHANFFRATISARFLTAIHNVENLRAQA